MDTNKTYEDQTEPQAQRYRYAKRQCMTLITACELYPEAMVFHSPVWDEGWIYCWRAAWTGEVRAMFLRFCLVRFGFLFVCVFQIMWGNGLEV